MEGDNVITSTLSLPNGNTDQFLNNNSINRNVLKTISYISTTVNLNLLTDDYGNETTWIFQDDNGVTLYQGGPYQDNITVTETFNVNPNTCYTFSILDSYGDGICCGFGIGNYTLTLSDGFELLNSGDFGSIEITNFGIVDVLNTESFEFNSIKIYPNPTTEVLNIDSVTPIQSMELFDISGKQILTTSQLPIQTSSLSRGVYLLKINFGTGKSTVEKVVKN
jgi:hypothetical protein